jgi:hypothetical protein
VVSKRIRWVVCALLALAVAGCGNPPAPPPAPAALEEPDEPRESPLWTGEAGHVPVKGVLSQLFPGERGVGDGVVEVELRETRTGRIASPVTLEGARGDIVIPAGAPVIAWTAGYASLDAAGEWSGVKWCTAPVEGGAVCMEPVAKDISECPGPAEGGAVACEKREDDAEARALRARYAEHEAGSQRLPGPAVRQEQPIGPPPEIREEPVAFDSALRRRVVIDAIGAGGVRLRRDLVEDGYVSKGGEGTFTDVPFGRVAGGDEDFGGARVVFSPAPGRPDRVLVIFAPAVADPG